MKTKEKKAEIIGDLSELFEKFPGVAVTAYKGLNMKELNEVRDKIRPLGGIKEKLINIKGEVIYCKEAEDQVFHTGVSFKETNKKMRKIVTKMIEAFYLQKLK